MAGGRPGALNRFFWQSDDGERSPPMVSKITDVKIAAGQRVRLETPGGGGWGDPRARDPGRVARDVRLGFLAIDAAALDYGVIVTAEGQLDDAGTAALRRGAAG